MQEAIADVLNEGFDALFFNNGDERVGIPHQFVERVCYAHEVVVSLQRFPGFGEEVLVLIALPLFC